MIEVNNENRLAARAAGDYRNSWICHDPLFEDDGVHLSACGVRKDQLIGRGQARKLCAAGAWALLALVTVCCAPAMSQDVAAPIVQGFGARTIFFMLFLMLGPIKVLLPFANMTRGRDPVFRRRLALRAILFS